MKKFLFFLLIFSSLVTTAQYKWDYGIKLGGANYLGDIGGKELTRREFVVDMHLQSTRYSAGLYGRYKFSKRLSINGNLDYLRITDTDALTTNPARRARNMNFRNDMFEFGMRAELTIWYDNDVGNRGYYNPDFKMFVFGGLSGFYSNPKGQIFKEGELAYDGEYFNLRDWMTEGQDKPYSQFGVAIPAGLGFYLTFDKTWRLGMEFSWRTTFTDYLDDISTTYQLPNTADPLASEFVNQSYPALIEAINLDNPDMEAMSVNSFQYVEGFETKRGDPTHNDSFLTAQLTIGKVIRGKSNFYRSKYSWMKNRAGVRRSKAKF